MLSYLVYSDDLDYDKTIIKKTNSFGNKSTSVTFFYKKYLLRRRLCLDMIESKGHE
jgi:hypothetical protein